MNLNAEDQQLVNDVETVMAEDIHGARGKIYLLNGALMYGWEKKADLYRRQLRAYVARRKMGEKITMNDICKDIK